MVTAAALHADAPEPSAAGQVAVAPQDRTTTSTAIAPTTTARRSTTVSSTSEATSTTAAPVTTVPTTTAAPPPVRPPDATAPAPPPTPAPTTECSSSAGPIPQWGQDQTRYDPSTVVRVGDPSGVRCATTRRVLVVGDSTGRGAANALRRTSPADLQVWDRTEIGCGMVAPGQCPDWRRIWAEAVGRIDPDVVLVHLGASGDLVAGEDPPFTTPQASALRRSEVSEAIRLLASKGARIAWVLPAVPLPSAWFFCGGTIPNTPCDPGWIDRWHVDVGAAAATLGVTVLDARAWIAHRAVAPSVDRPDGLHLTGPALDDQARWIVPTLRALAG